MAQAMNTGALPKMPVDSPARGAHTSRKKLSCRAEFNGTLDIAYKDPLPAAKPKKRWNKHKKKGSLTAENSEDQNKIHDKCSDVSELNVSPSTTFVPPHPQPDCREPEPDHTEIRPKRSQAQGHVPSPNFRALVLPRVAPFCGAALVLDENFIKEVPKWHGKEQVNSEYDCALCKYHCDNLVVVEKHINDSRHLENMKVRLEQITMENLPKPFPGQLAALTQLVQNVFTSCGMFAEDQSTRREIAEYVHSIVNQAFPTCLVRLYGSTASGMGLKTSDINLDLVVNSSETLSKIILAVTDLLGEEDRFESVKCNLNAEVPGITFVDRASKVNCQMCLNNHRAFDTSKLLECYESIDLRVRYLAVMFRVWAKMCDIDQVDLGAWPPYAFSLKLVYFLQQIEPPVLPVLHDLVDPIVEKKPEFYINPEDLEGKWVCKNVMSLGELWLSLLRFYALDFATSDLIVCIQQLAPLKRSVKKWTGRKTAIEDPFVSKRNVSRTIVNMITFDYIVMCLRKTYLYFAIPQTATGPIFGSIRKTLESDSYGPDYAKFLRGKHAELDNIIKYDECFAKSQDSRKSLHYGGIEVSPECAYVMFQKYNPSHFAYAMVRLNFAGSKPIPQVCSICERSGHLKAVCPEEKLPELKPLPPMTAQLEDFLTTLCNHTFAIRSPNQEELEERQTVVEHIQQFLRVDFPDAKLELFGSSCNGFGLVKSDLDICLTFKNNLTGEKLNFAEIIDQIHLKLRKCKGLSGLVAITTAKVPILKFVHLSSKLEGDISVYNTLAQRNTKMLRVYAEIDPRVKILGFMVKELAKLCDICDASRGSLSSYAYILMVIYFLQRCDPPLVPVLQELHLPGRPCEPVMVEGCNTYFLEDVGQIGQVWDGIGKNTTSVGLLWLQLLQFYTEQFDYSLNVVSIRQMADLPRYDKLWNSKSMAIEDPFDLTHNLGVALSKNMHIFVLKALMKARTRFGTPVKLANASGGPPTPDLLSGHFLNKVCMVDSNPPNDRGCRACKKIGHQVKDCPIKKAHAEWKSRKAKLSEPGPQRDRLLHANAVYQQGNQPAGIHRVDRLPAQQHMFQRPPMAAGYKRGNNGGPNVYLPPQFGAHMNRGMALANHRGHMSFNPQLPFAAAVPRGVPRGIPWNENGQQQRFHAQRPEPHMMQQQQQQLQEMGRNQGSRTVGYVSKFFPTKENQY